MPWCCRHNEGENESMTGLRVMIYDRTCGRAGIKPGLSHAWWLGSYLYRGLGRFDCWRGVSSWREAFDFLNSLPEPIAEIQYWGHGKWGEAWIDRDCLDVNSLTKTSEHAKSLDRLAQQLVPATSLLWFRTCETAGAVRGMTFVENLADRLGCRVAGHTYIIGPWQSGLHSIAPGCAPDWDRQEGLAQGTAENPKRAHWSHRRATNTISCLHGAIPRGY